MGYDDGDCDASPDGLHVVVLDELVVAGGGQVDELHHCSACGAVVYAAGEDAARPPL